MDTQRMYFEYQDVYSEYINDGNSSVYNFDIVMNLISKEDITLTFTHNQADVLDTIFITGVKCMDRSPSYSVNGYIKKIAPNQKSGYSYELRVEARNFLEYNYFSNIEDICFNYEQSGASMSLGLMVGLGDSYDYSIETIKLPSKDLKLLLENLGLLYE